MPTKHTIHILSNIDEENKSAQCSKCSTLVIVRKKTGRESWVCTLKPKCIIRSLAHRTKHKLSNIDELGRTAECSLCERTVTIGILNKKWKCIQNRIIAGRANRKASKDRIKTQQLLYDAALLGQPIKCRPLKDMTSAEYIAWKAKYEIWMLDNSIKPKISHLVTT